ncbi:DEAD/DEAH box helicase [Micromonospora sp. NPDC048843]|uniref:DEAD/DEAH box helicase n=1 Tax=Micromonospora sp. NPDC048843 TaxID=3155389 RepID=UPI0033E5DB35
MAFKGGAKKAVAVASPEVMYRDLPRRPNAVQGLWTHQGDLLRRYATDHTTDPDLALELPTGTGKTLPGLVIANWVRVTRRSRVAYACPTQQLASQVAKVAAREGVPAVTLMGSHASWPTADRAAYEAADAVAVTTYNTIFNSNPHLATPDLLLFDDAHAGEQYVSEQYAIHLRRSTNQQAYTQLLDVLAPAIDGIPLQRLRDYTPDPGMYRSARLVVPLRQPEMVSKIDAVLAQLPAPWTYRYSMIRDAIPSCLAYVSYSAILIRPVIPPTSKNLVFTQAAQRIYLSATLGSGGELERAFGRPAITRVALPNTAPTPRSGRRFFVFPELAEVTDAQQLARSVVAAAGKALVLAPDTNTALSTASDLAQPGWPVLGINDVESGMEQFAALPNAVCGLAARYDGLDLPGDDCRVVVLNGKPDTDSLQERFLSQNVRAGAALAERVRTRVVQGVGRCTRGPNDWAVVIVLGADLTTYMVRPEIRQALDPELQAEIDFGIQNSRRTSATDILDNVTTFLRQDDAWRTDAEPIITELRNEATLTPPPASDALAAAVKSEVEASSLAGMGEWQEASARANEAALELGKGGDALRGYRSFWLYLAATWADQAGVTTANQAHRQNAVALAAQAEAAAKPSMWIRELAPIPTLQPSALSSASATAVAAVAARLRSTSIPKAAAAAEEMLAALKERKPTVYEPALTKLGYVLGADAQKPPGSGRCDSTWCWDHHLWLAIDAKSDHEPSGLVPQKDIRQAGDQLRLLRSDRVAADIPPDSATVIVSPKPAVDPTGAAGAEPHVHVVHPDVVLGLAEAAARAWGELMAQRPGLDDNQLRALVAGHLGQEGLLPEQVRERLTVDPVAPQ